MIRVLALVLAALAVLSLFIGDGRIAVPDVLILTQDRPTPHALGLLVGGGLGLSGAVLPGGAA